MTQQIKFTYPAYIHDITHTSGLTMVEVGVDVDGRYFTLRCPAGCFDCELMLEKQVMCEGIEEGGKKTLRFREIEPIKLSKAQLMRLKKLVSALKPI
jgi:hypothetical protein